MYSQYLEEESILGIVDVEFGREPQRFLDIGSWHPTDKSNTRALYELGWGGIVIEPSPGPVQNLIREYGGKDSRVQVIAAAITPDERKLIQLEVTDDAVTQPVESFNEAWRDCGYYGRLTVPCISVRSLFEMFGGDFEMVSIDTEGSSGAVFKAMLDAGPRPRCVVVEHDGAIVEISDHAQANHYQTVHLNGTNIVFRWTGGRER